MLCDDSASHDNIHLKHRCWKQDAKPSQLEAMDQTNFRLAYISLQSCFCYIQVANCIQKHSTTSYKVWPEIRWTHLCHFSNIDTCPLEGLCSSTSVWVFIRFATGVETGYILHCWSLSLESAYTMKEAQTSTPAKLVWRAAFALKGESRTSRWVPFSPTR